MEPGSKQALSPDYARAELLFDQFVSAQTFKGIQGTFRLLCDSLRIRPTNFTEFYPKLKSKLKSWKAQALWLKFDKRASHKCYNRGKACANTRVLIIGAGPCGLRTAIEAQLLGAKVVVIEKRDRLSRNNVLHLWPFVIHDLKSLGAKKFYGKFCAGAIDHISIRQLQCILLKVALLLGVEVHESVSFEDLIDPPSDQSQEKIGWRALLNPKDHPVSHYEFDVLVGADGKRNTLKGFKRKEFRGKLAIAVTANFINRHSEEEARVQEISGVAFIFNQKFFTDLRDNTAIDLENIVYYKDETHYFVMTAKKFSLICKGVILNDYADTAKLLAPENVNREALLEYAREAADFSTDYKLPSLEFAVNHYGQPDVAMFDFTSMFAAESACRVVERRGHRLLQALVGDSLLEPFWPTGSGCGRGFLSSLDACWMIRSWSLGCMTPLQVLAERESIYRLLAQTNADNICKDYSEYTLIPSSRYPNLNINAVRPTQVIGLFDTDGDIKDEPLEILPFPNKKRKRDSIINPETLLQWCQRQVSLYTNVSIENMTISWQNGLALCAILHRYRPDLLDFNSLREEEAEPNCQLVFDIIEREYGIQPVITASELANSMIPDSSLVISYVSQIYDTFRGEIPHVGVPITDLSPEEKPPSPIRKPTNLRLFALARQRLSSRKRFSLERLEKENDRIFGFGLDIDRDKETETLRRNKKRKSLERDRARFILNKDIIQPSVISHQKTEATEEDRENFHLRVKNLEEKLYGSDKKYTQTPPKVVKVGRIDRGDWNVKMLEDRLKGNQPPMKKEREEVPKWSKDIFEDKRRAMDQKLRSDNSDEPTKYIDFDSRLRMLDKKLKEGNNLETGQRGMNKVSAMAEYLAATLEPKQEHVPLQRTNSQGSVVSIPNAEEICHICGKRVYFMEKYTAEGKIFHRGCFKCECCGVSLRLGNYGVGTDGHYNGKFLCTYHFNTRITPRKRPQLADLNFDTKNTRVSPTMASLGIQPETPPKDMLDLPDGNSFKNRGITPERVEFENTLDLTSEEELLSEIDEDDWTERNFGNSASEYDSTDPESDFSSDDMSDTDQEELEEALQNNLTSDETIRLAENWRRRHNRNWRAKTKEDNEEDTDEEYDESSDEYSYEEYENEDDESTATEGEVQDGAGEGPSEHVISADELDKEGEVQITVPQQMDKIWKNDYQTLNSNIETATEGSDSKTSDSELYSGSDTETESGSHMDEGENDLDDGKTAATEDVCVRSDEIDAPSNIFSKKQHKHFIPTIVIDEMTACPPNEDDDSYFVTLQEQNLKAEKTLENLIHEQSMDDNIQTPETPSVVEHFVGEEICPLVTTDKQDSCEFSTYNSAEGPNKTEGSSDAETKSAYETEMPLNSSAPPEDVPTTSYEPVIVQSDNKTVCTENVTAVEGSSPVKIKPQRPLSFVETAVKLEPAEKKFGSDPDVTTKLIAGKEHGDFPHFENASTLNCDNRTSQELSSSLPNLAKTKDKENSPSSSSRNVVADTPTAMRMLRLKEKYLLGNISTPEETQSSSEEVPAKLEPVVKSFLEVISEKQKMLFQSPSSPSPLSRFTGLSIGELSPSSPSSTVSSTPDTPRFQMGSPSFWSRTPSSILFPSALGSGSLSSSPISYESGVDTLANVNQSQPKDISPDESNENCEACNHADDSLGQQDQDCKNESTTLPHELDGLTADLPPALIDDDTHTEVIKEGAVLSVSPDISAEKSDENHDTDQVLQEGSLQDPHEYCPNSKSGKDSNLPVAEGSDIAIGPNNLEILTESLVDVQINSIKTEMDLLPNSTDINDASCSESNTQGDADQDFRANLNMESETCVEGVQETVADISLADSTKSQESSNFSANSTFFDNIDSRYITFRDKTQNNDFDLSGDSLCPLDSTEVTVDSEVNDTVDESSSMKEKEVLSNDEAPLENPQVTTLDVAPDPSNINIPVLQDDKKGNDDSLLVIADSEVLLKDSRTETCQEDVATAHSEALSKDSRTNTCQEDVATADSEALSKDSRTKTCQEDVATADSEVLSKDSRTNTCQEDVATAHSEVLSKDSRTKTCQEGVATAHLEALSKDSRTNTCQEDVAKSDDELMEMFSSHTSSDSDTTPSLDESIYNNPDIHVAPSSKFEKYVSRVAEHSFTFGGVRDSIDVRRSAISKKSPSSGALSYLKQDCHNNANSRLVEETSATDGLANLQRRYLDNGKTEVTTKTVEEIPYVDDESSQESSERGARNKQASTSQVPFKRPPLLRPLSMIETSSTPSSFLMSIKKNALIDTPLSSDHMETHTTPKSVGEAVDDLRQLRSVEREMARQQARERARLKSDEELGLNNVSYSNLRKKYQKADGGGTVDIQEENQSLEVPLYDAYERQPSSLLPPPPSVLSSLVTQPADDKNGPLSGDSARTSLPSSEKAVEEVVSDSSSPDSEVFEACSPPVSPVATEQETGWSTPDSGDQVLNSESACSVTTSSFYEDGKKDSSPVTSGSVSTPSKTDCASYLEPELSIETVDIKIVAEVPDIAKVSSNNNTSVGNSGSVKAKSSSLPGIMMLRKDKSKNQKSESSGSPEKSDKPKSKERKSLLSIFSAFGKSDGSKSRSKDKEEKDRKREKSLSSSSAANVEVETCQVQSVAAVSPLEGANLKVDGTPKESRFSKLKLARSKEKAKEKRKQKYLVDTQKQVCDPQLSKDIVELSQKIDDVVIAPEVSSPPESAPILSTSSSPSTEITVSPLHLSNRKVKKPTEITLDRNALIASMSSISKQIPPAGKLGNGVAPQASEDSFSDPEEDNAECRSQASSGNGKKTKDLLEERKRKFQKVAQRMQRQQEQKRLRMAQEIQRQLEELEVRQRTLESRGVKVEKALRGEGEGLDALKEETELMQEWFHLVHSKNVLVRQEQELMVKAKDLDLEDRHSRLQHKLQQRMAIDDSVKTAEEIEEESRILAEMLEIVEQRDTLIALLEENRQRHQEEDKDLELNMLAKGLFFQPTQS